MAGFVVGVAGPISALTVRRHLAHGPTEMRRGVKQHRDRRRVTEAKVRYVQALSEAQEKYLIVYRARVRSVRRRYPDFG
jgi:hypothetical protein